MNSAINKRYAQELVAERTIAEIAEAGSYRASGGTQRLDRPK